MFIGTAQKVEFYKLYFIFRVYQSYPFTHAYVSYVGATCVLYIPKNGHGKVWYRKTVPIPNFLAFPN